MLVLSKHLPPSKILSVVSHSHVCMWVVYAFACIQQHNSARILILPRCTEFCSVESPEAEIRLGGLLQPRITAQYCTWQQLSVLVYLRRVGGCTAIYPTCCPRRNYINDYGVVTLNPTILPRPPTRTYTLNMCISTLR